MSSSGNEEQAAKRQKIEHADDSRSEKDDSAESVDKAEPSVAPVGSGTASVQLPFDSNFPGAKGWAADWDSRPTTAPADVFRKIVLIRHGEYNGDKTNAVKDFAAQLNTIGRKQADDTGETLNDLIAGWPGCTLVSSTMTRAKQTADRIYAKCEMSRGGEDPMLIEGSPYPYVPSHTDWSSLSEMKKQAMNDNYTRLNDAFVKYFNRPTSENDETVILVCHANVIRYFMCRSLQLPLESMHRFKIEHCSITVIQIDHSGKATMLVMNDTNHLEDADPL